MAGDRGIPPPVMWAQRSDKLYITINMEDIKDPIVKLEDQKLHFKGKGGPDRKDYELELDFFQEIDPKESKYVVLARHVPMIIQKKEGGSYWPRLLKEAKKNHWLKTDFAKWRDEDDSDVEETEDMGLEDMMKQMGNFNTSSPEEPENEEDSDDDDLPDLE